MSHQFKPGDLALIVGAHRFKENIGSVVEIVAFLTVGQRYKTPDGATVNCTGNGWEVTGESVCGGYTGRRTGRVTRTPKHGFVDPAHLIPLRGDFSTEQYKSHKVTA